MFFLGEGVPRDKSIPIHGLVFKVRGYHSDVKTVKEGLFFKVRKILMTKPHGFYSKRLNLIGKG